MKRYLITLLLCLFAGAASFAQGIDRVKLDSLFNSLSKNNLAMGSIAISKNGKVIYQKAIGFSQIHGVDSTVANGQTRYRIGSITKMFTAAIIFQLIEKGELSLSDTLSKYFPQLPNASRITIGNMLYHRSGLPNFTNHTNYDDWKDKPKTHQELLDMIINQKPDFEPNAKADYNNSNYLLLGYIAEKIYHKPYKDILNERIINRIGLTQTYYGDASPRQNESSSYKYFNNQWQADKAAYLDNFCGAGAIISTPADMLKFMNALFAYKIVSKTSLDKMKTFIDGYGMGMFPYEFESHHGFGHNGKTEGFASSLSYYPEDGIAIAYCTNGEVYPKAQILDIVRNICFNKPPVIPTFKPVKLSDEVLNKYTGIYSSSDSSLKVVCTKEGNNLVLETRGQKMKLDALTPNEFINKPFGFFFDFSVADKQLIIKDVDDVYYLNKK